MRSTRTRRASVSLAAAAAVAAAAESADTDQQRAAMAAAAASSSRSAASRFRLRRMSSQHSEQTFSTAGTDPSADAVRYVHIDMLLEHLVHEFMRVRREVEAVLIKLFTDGDENADGVLTCVGRLDLMEGIRFSSAGVHTDTHTLRAHAVVCACDSRLPGSKSSAMYAIVQLQTSRGPKRGRCLTRHLRLLKRVGLRRLKMTP